MDKQKKSINIATIHSMSGLEKDEILLCERAKNAIGHAYAPYSNYQVGSAVLLENGEIVEGSNQENAVFPLGLCAERVALFAASTLYPNVKIKAIAVQTIKNDRENQLPGFPCGSCRQVIVDMEYRHQAPIKVIVLGLGEEIFVVEKGSDLLPFAFNHDAL